jgi:hypothetical protein
MTDEPTSGAAPAVTSVTTPAPAATITSPEPQAGDGNTDHISLDEARKLRSEAQALRKRLKAFEDAEQAAKDAQLGEVERLNKQAAALQEQHDTMAAQLAESLVRQEVADHISKFNFAISAKTVANLLLLDFDAIEFEDGKPTNVEKLLEKLAKAEPDIVKQEAGAPAQSGVPSLPAMNPGRSTITQPGQQQPGRIPRLTDPGLWKS